MFTTNDSENDLAMSAVADIGPDDIKAKVVEEIKSPNWNNCIWHDWVFCVPEQVRALWPTLTYESKVIAYMVAIHCLDRIPGCDD